LPLDEDDADQKSIVEQSLAQEHFQEKLNRQRRIEIKKASKDKNRPDKAMETAVLSKKPYKGGIDLNSRNLNMESSGQKVNITFDPAMLAQFERGDFSGVRIKILDVVPISLMPLLGLKEDESVGQLAKA